MNLLEKIHKLFKFCKKNKHDSVVLINPNNPNGGYLKYKYLRYILNNLKEIINIISFLQQNLLNMEYT
jgi:histidinol-phosphate/aromatic aminotransferase/cobyric acid decarboxylase-like protein